MLPTWPVVRKYVRHSPSPSTERMYALYKAVEYVVEANIPGDFAECGVWRGGSVMVIGHDRDILDVAENFLDFFVEESCGQCTPCRLGNPQMLEAVQLLKKGECPPEFLKSVKELGATMQVASKCCLGQTSPSAFLSILEGFGDEIANRAPSA